MRSKPILQVPVHTSEATALEFASARRCRMVIRHLTVPLDPELVSFASSIDLTAVSSTDSSMECNDFASTPSPAMFCAFARLKEPLFTRNGDTTYLRFQPGVKLSWAFPDDGSFFLSIRDFSFFLHANPRRALLHPRWMGVSSMNASFWPTAEDAFLEKASVLVLEVISELSSVIDRLFCGKFKRSLDDPLGFFKSLGCGSPSLFVPLSRHTEVSAWWLKLKFIYLNKFNCLFITKFQKNIQMEHNEKY